jgi:hypothetical protein
LNLPKKGADKKAAGKSRPSHWGIYEETSLAGKGYEEDYGVSAICPDSRAKRARDVNPQGAG